MSNTTHPERKAGQRWLGSSHTWTLRGRLLASSSFHRGQWEAFDEDGAWAIFSDRQLDNFTLLAPAPSARPACKAWCGFIFDSETDERRARWIDAGSPHRLFGTMRTGEPAYCSESCVPPLSAQGEAPWCAAECSLPPFHGGRCKPVETAKCELGGVAGKCGHVACNEERRHGETAKAVCIGPGDLHHVNIELRICRFGGAVRPRWICESCYLSWIEPNGGGSDVLHNDKHPALLPRPRMAHVSHNDWSIGEDA